MALSQALYRTALGMGLETSQIWLVLMTVAVAILLLSPGWEERVYKPYTPVNTRYDATLEDVWHLTLYVTMS